MQLNLCSGAGFIKTVAEGQCFVTLDDAELAKLSGSCREYTLHRDDQLSIVEGWIRGNTKIGPGDSSQLPPRPWRDLDQNQIPI